MQLGEIMNRRVVTVGLDDAASAAWSRMRRRGIRHLVVMDGPTVAGVISERDLGGRRGAGLRRGRKVRELMTADLVTAAPETTLRDAVNLVRKNLIGSLPVLEDGRLVGIVTATDVFDALGYDSAGARDQLERRLLRAPSTSRRLGGQPVVPRPRRGTRAPARRARRSNESKRAPLAARLPRAAKRAVGRTDATLTPANIRAMGVKLGDEEREYIRSKLGRKLGKFATSIERVTVRLRDVNGPRGGVDKACRIKVVLSGMPSVVFEERGTTSRAAFDAALAGTERAVRRALRQRLTRPIRETA